jgi:ribosomal-protein-alanine N-acetyltransferase
MINLHFTPFPLLTTERLTLRQLEVEDKEQIFALRSSLVINKYIDRDPSKSIEDAVRFIDIINENIGKNNSIYWVIALSNSQTFVGTICLYDFSKEKDSCEIGYELMEEYQGMGIMKEAVEAVIHYAFHSLQIKKIIASTHKENLSSTKLLSTFNFILSDKGMNENADYDMFTLENA